MIDLYPAEHPPAPALDSAGPGLLRRRALATLLDLGLAYLLVESVLVAGITVVAPGLIAARPGLAFIGSLVALAPIHATYCFAFEWRYDRTPGKVRFELTVTTVDGERPGLLAAAVRNLLRYVDWLPVGYLLGWGLARTSPTGQRLGDRLAGTVVVRPAAVVEDGREGGDGERTTG